MDRRILRFAVPALAALGIGMGCSNREAGPITGITTIGNTVAGVVVDQDGKAVPDAVVSLFVRTYNPASEKVEPDNRTTRTDASGRYVFEEVREGAYNIEPEGKGVEMALLQDLRLGAKGKVEAPRAVLTGPGGVVVDLANHPLERGGVLYLPGTSRFVVLDSQSLQAGEATLPRVAAGMYADLRYQGPGMDSAVNLLADSIEVKSGEIIRVNPLAVWKLARKITLQTGLSGADIRAPLIDFPVLVRLDSSNFDFAASRPDGADLRFAKADGTPLAYEIERWDPSRRQGQVWVRLDTVFASQAAQTFHLYAGWADAGSLSQGSAVFTSTAGFGGVWHLGGKVRLEDATTGGNAGTGIGTSSSEGIAGAALEFRDSARATLPAPAFSGIGSAVAFSFWQFGTPGDSLRKSHLFSAQDSTGQMVFKMHLPYGDTVIYWDAGSRDAILFDRLNKRADSAIQYAGRWNFWTVTKDVAKGEMKVYLNGELWISAVGRTIPLNRVASFQLGISAQPYLGLLDEFRVSTVVPGEDWVKLSFATQRPGSRIVLVESR